MREDLPLSKLKLLKRNPRRITSSQMAKLCQSLKNDPEFLQKRPVLVNHIDGEYQVYAGNQRVRAARRLKWRTIPCDIDENLSQALMRERVLRDNKTFGEFDYDILSADYEVQELIEYGWTPEELAVDPRVMEEAENGEGEENNQLQDPPKNPITKLGDIYQLGDHRLQCGDSMDSAAVISLLNNEEPILMVTDPPYGVNYEPEWRSGVSIGCGVDGKVLNDDRINWTSALKLFPGSVAYVWHAAKYCSEVKKSLEDSEFEIISQIIWEKQHFTISRGDYHWQHEPCWYAHRKGHKHNWQGSRKETTVWKIDNLNSFGGNKEEERTEHSTQKPLQCMMKPIKNNTFIGEGVYDPFCGSGTTLIAAEITGRKAFCMELSPSYCDLIVNRWIRHRKKNNRDCSLRDENDDLVTKFNTNQC